MGVFRSRTTKQTKSGSKKSYVCKTWRARAKDPVTGERIEKAGFRTKTEGQAWKFSTEKGEGRVQAARSIPNLIDEFRAQQQDKATSEAQIKLIRRTNSTTPLTRQPPRSGQGLIRAWNQYLLLVYEALELWEIYNNFLNEKPKTKPAPYEPDLPPYEPQGDGPTEPGRRADHRPA